MISYLFGLLSAISFGISNTYWKQANSTVSFPGLVFFRGIIASICFGMIWFTFSDLHIVSVALINPNTTLNQYVLTIFLCFICSLGLVFYLKSLEYTSVALSVPLSSINIFGILTAIIVLHEHFKSIYYFSFGIGILGVLLSQSHLSKSKVTWNKGATFSILASFFWGSTYTLFKYPANWMGAIPLAFILESAVVLVAFIWIQITEKEFFKSKMILSNKNIKHYFILASFLLCGNLFFNLAVQKIPILVINIYGFFTLFISISTGLLFYKEKVSLKQAIGILCLLVSIYAVK